jgi:putative endonuclease
MSDATQALGLVGEELASQYLAGEGYRVLLKNFECVFGEIDLIAKEKGVLTFVEVKTRSNGSMGHPAEAVTHHKRGQIIKSAQFYLKRYGIHGLDCRFDVVSVVLPPGGEPSIELIRGAFEA